MIDKPALDFDASVRDAWQAFHAHELPEAVRRWKLVAEAWPDSPLGPLGLAISHRGLQEFDVAEALISDALSRFPDDTVLIANAGWIAQDRGAWTRAAEHWQRYRGLLPDDPIGASALGVALRHLQRYDEADAVIAQALGDHPDHAELLGNYARTAQQRGDRDEALRRWTLYRNRFPDQTIGYASVGVVLRELRRYDEADTVLRAGLQLDPNDVELVGNYAWVAYHRNDWPEALKRWDDFRNKFPDLPLGQAQLALVLGALGRFNEAMSVSHDAISSRSMRSDAAGLMLEFESPGDDCEFGVVQRHFGAEPLGLLRFTSTPPAPLTEALRQRFAGVGDPDVTELVVHDGEYMTCDRRYLMSMHTFIRAAEGDRDKRYENFCRRLRFLRDRLVENLENCEKIFVYAYHDRLPEDGIRSLWKALRNYGKNRLLFAQLADEDYPAGTIRQLEEDLVVAHFARLSVSDPPYDEWLAVCRTVHGRWSPATGDTECRDHRQHQPRDEP